MKKRLLLILGILALGFCGACQAKSDHTGAGTMIVTASEKPQELDEFKATLGTSTLRLMLARTEDEKRTGLMYRVSLGDDQGMLFCYDEPEIMHFWMKNTRIPLDLVFFSPDLRVTEYIKGMTPGYGQPDNTLPRYSSLQPAQYALELPAGTVVRLGIKTGDTLVFAGPVSLAATP